MTENTVDFYEQLADSYHLIFDDWDSSIKRQASVLDHLLTSHTNRNPLRILDCACGIGTQALGLAMMGHHVVASDFCEAAIHRARMEARRRELEISFHVSDIMSLKEIPLSEIPEEGFDAVVAMDNVLPHLSADQLTHATQAMASKLRPGGILMASLRDYDSLIVDRPRIQEPVFYGAQGGRRIVHQVWDWIDSAGDGPGYVLHLYITIQSHSVWETRHFVSRYRCLLRHELSASLIGARFSDVRWLMPAETGFYQPIVTAILMA